MNLKAIEFEVNFQVQSSGLKHQQHVRHGGAHEGEFGECTKLFAGMICIKI